VHPQDIARESYFAAPWIRQLQVVQDEIDKFRLMVVPARPPSPDEVEAILPALLDFIGEGVSLEVVIVDRIDRSEESKFRVYKSAVS
jgi:hypothetical protein